jgi:hypothetical protein
LEEFASAQSRARTGESYTAARRVLIAARAAADAERCDEMKLRWRERLTALKPLLEEGMAA